MRLALSALWIASLLAAFALGRWAAPTGPPAPGGTLEALRAGLAERDGLVRAQLLSRALVQLQPDDLPGVEALIEESRLQILPDDVRLLMLAWSRFDAPGAFAWAQAWPTSWNEKLMEEAMYAWGFRDGPAALAAAEKIDDKKLRGSLQSSALDGWLRSDDRVGASSYIAGVGDPRLRRRLTFTLAGEAARDGVDAVIAWAEAVPEDAPNDFKQGSFFHAANVIARSDPRRAAAWWEQHRDQPYSEGSLETIARKWAQHHDPPALFSWLRSLPPGEGDRADEVGEAVRTGFRAWRQKDPEAARSWLEASLPDPKLDPAVEEYSWSVVQTAPDEAVSWAQRMADEKLRQRTLTRLVRSWLRRDPQAAGQWLAQSDVPESVKQSIVAGVRSARAVRGRVRAGAAAPAARDAGEGRPSAGQAEPE
jgi:hypothetical protein